MIYLDNAATTKIDPEVLEAMMPYLTEEYGNPGGLYRIGKAAKNAVENARSQVAEFIGAKPEQIIFTSGGSEANNIAIKSFVKSKEIITDKTEHDSVLKTIASRNIRGEVKYVPINPFGSVEFTSFCDKITKNTEFVSIMYVNNETGSENPVHKIGAKCRESGIIFHTDCVQAAGCKLIDVNELSCDFLSISSHKIHGPKGTGALFVRDKHLCDPLICGGSDQEFGLRGGTENVAGIIGFAKACEITRNNFSENVRYVGMLKTIFYNELMLLLDGYGIIGTLHVNGSYPGTGKTINIRFDGIDAHTLILMLDLYGVYVSVGSACTSRDNVPSHVLLAMGLTPDEARSSIRVSFSRMNTVSDVMEAASIIAKSVSLLKTS